MIIDCHNHVGVELGVYLRGEFPYAQHLETLVREGEALGIERWVVFPMVTNLALNLKCLRESVVTSYEAWERVPYAWENRRLMQEVYELFPETGRKTLPFAMFDPSREVKAQARELRLLHSQYRFYGLKTQPTMLESPITALHDVAHVFLDLAQEWDIPLLIHSSVIPSDVWAQASDIIDIAAQTPAVRFCVAHSCRFDWEQLKRIAALPNCWFDCSAHGIHCELAVQNHPIVAPAKRRFPSKYSSPSQVLKDLVEAYPTKLLWGSDSPYYSFVSGHDDKQISLLSSYAREVESLQTLSASLMHLVSHSNTLAWLQCR